MTDSPCPANTRFSHILFRFVYFRFSGIFNSFFCFILQLQVSLYLLRSAYIKLFCLLACFGRSRTSSISSSLLISRVVFCLLETLTHKFPHYTSCFLYNTLKVAFIVRCSRLPLSSTSPLKNNIIIIASYCYPSYSHLQESRDTLAEIPSILCKDTELRVLRLLQSLLLLFSRRTSAYFLFSPFIRVFKTVEYSCRGLHLSLLRTQSNVSHTTSFSMHLF